MYNLKNIEDEDQYPTFYGYKDSFSEYGAFGLGELTEEDVRKIAIAVKADEGSSFWMDVLYSALVGGVSSLILYWFLKK